MIEFETYIITNGRSTFPYALQSIENQSIGFKIGVLENMKWGDALALMLSKIETPFFIRFDDDHFIHPRGVEFLVESMENAPEGTAVLYSYLWEDYSGRKGGGVKIYNTEITRKIGGFIPSDLGKVDKNFKKQVKDNGFLMGGCGKSMVGIHAAGSPREQLRYETLWNSISGRKHHKPDTSNYDIPVKDQFNMRTYFIEEKNRKLNSSFHQFLTRGSNE